MVFKQLFQCLGPDLRVPFQGHCFLLLLRAGFLCLMSQSHTYKQQQTTFLFSYKWKVQNLISKKYWFKGPMQCLVGIELISTEDIIYSTEYTGMPNSHQKEKLEKWGAWVAIKDFDKSKWIFILERDWLYFRNGMWWWWHVDYRVRAEFSKVFPRPATTDQRYPESVLGEGQGDQCVPSASSESVATTFFYCWRYWDLNPEPCACQAEALSLEPHPQPLVSLLCQDQPGAQILLLILPA